MQRFKFSTKDDFVIYLWYLLRSAYSQIDRHNVYLKQLNNIILEKELNIPGSKVTAAVYGEHRDKLEHISNFLSNLMGDHADKAASYKKFRCEAEKKNAELGLGLLPLDVEISKMLNNMNINRNWALHIPESLITAEREIREQILKKGEVVMVFNPVEVGYHHYCDGKLVISLRDENIIARKYFITIFRQMKKDYSALIGDNVEMKWKERNIRTDDDLLPVEISAQVQYKIYSGIDSEKIDDIRNRIIETNLGE